MFDVDSLLTTFGLAGIMIIIFMETGVLIGFIFPGDTLLFTAGIMAASEHPFAPLWALCIGVPVAAALGDQLGYTLGRRYGPAALESRVLNWIGPEAVTRTEDFFARYGAVTVLFARFIAVVRTLNPLVAGIAKMPRATFTFWSILGCFLWGGRNHPPGLPARRCLLHPGVSRPHHHRWNLHRPGPPADQSCPAADPRPPRTSDHDRADQRRRKINWTQSTAPAETSASCKASW